MAPKHSPRELEPLDPLRTDETYARIRARLEARIPDKRGNPTVPEEVARAILDFADSTERMVKKIRQLTYINTLPLIAQRIGYEEFLHPTSETPDHFRRAYRDAKGWTVMSQGAVAMKFWAWLFKQRDEEPPKGLSIRVSKKTCAHKSASVVITADEVARLVAAAVTSRDKALIACLYESGCRIGELLTLRLRDVERSDRGGFRLHVDGKTGKRSVPLFESSVPTLNAWLHDHPLADDPTAPLWCHVQSTEGRLGHLLTYNGFRKILRTAARRAGVEKGVNPHAFRHSRATMVAQSPVSASVFEDFFGWKHGSPMASEYVHLSGREVEDGMARALGVEKAPAPRAAPSLPVSCPRCQFVNDSTHRFCGQCAAPLTASGLGDTIAADKQARDLNAVLSSPKVVEFIAQQLAKSAA